MTSRLLEILGRGGPLRSPQPMPLDGAPPMAGTALPPPDLSSESPYGTPTFPADPMMGGGAGTPMPMTPDELQRHLLIQRIDGQEQTLPTGLTIPKAYAPPVGPMGRRAY